MWSAGCLSSRSRCAQTWWIYWTTGAFPLSIPCSSFHHCSAMRAAEATTTVLLWTKILTVQLDLIDDRIIPLPHPQRSWELPRLLWSHGRCNGGISAAESVLPHWSCQELPHWQRTGSRLRSPTITASGQRTQLYSGAWHLALTKSGINGH